MSVREASNGQEGLDALHAAASYLVLLDLVMPVLDRFTFLLKMREQEAFRASLFRFAVLVPKPRVNLTRFHGVFAPNNKHQLKITLKTAVDGYRPQLSLCRDRFPGHGAPPAGNGSGGCNWRPRRYFTSA
jgi:CheY-like chemotaxis protein